MAVLWVLLGFGGMITLLALLDRTFGRGHLGAKQSESHYLDEVEAMAHTPYI